MRTLLTAGSFILLSAAITAQDPPVIRVDATPLTAEAKAARKWLDRLSAQVGRPIELDQFMDAFVFGATVSGSGHFVYADSGYFSAQQTLKQSFEGQEKPRSRTMLMVGDGQNMWLESRDDLVKGPLVRLLPLAKMREVGNLPGTGFGAGDVHPFRQLIDAARMASLELNDVNKGRIVLKGGLSEEAKYKLGDAFMGLEVKTFQLILDEQTALPISMRVDGESGLFVQYRYTNIKQPRREDIDFDKFRYQPPEGAQVVDLSLELEQERKAQEAAKQGGATPRPDGGR